MSVEVALIKVVFSAWGGRSLKLGGEVAPTFKPLFFKSKRDTWKFPLHKVRGVSSGKETWDVLLVFLLMVFFFLMTEKTWDEHCHEITTLDNSSVFFPSPFCRLRDTQGDTYNWWPNGWQFVWRLAVLKRRSPLNGFPGNPKRTRYLECFFLLQLQLYLFIISKGL